MTIKAVLFDLGDTLWHFPNMPPREVFIAETVGRISRLLGEWGMEMTEERRMMGRDIRMAVEEETSRAFHGDCVDPGYPELCRIIAGEHGLKLSVSQGEELWEAWNLGGAFLGRVLFPDVLETLGWLKARGYRLAAVTNRGYSGPRFHEEMRDLGLAVLFEEMVISCDVGFMKPHPRIFEDTLSQMQISAEEAVMVGDSLRADVEGSKALGMIAVWRRPVSGEPVETTEDEPEDDGMVTPDYVIDEVSELMALSLFQPL